MLRIVFIIFLAFSSFFATAQMEFKTMVTQSPVVVGESFQVQYVLSDVVQDGEFLQPDFKGFRVVNGPYVYTGSSYGPNGQYKLKNIVYTLVPLKTGKFIIPGASARMNGEIIRSENAFLVVVSKAEAYKRGMLVDKSASRQEYYLAPGEDPFEKIRQNLFIRVMVNKKSCFVGEPITAVFKLYSRVESKSDIVKNPGFYGFTVQDMVGLHDRMVGTETINGKRFYVHTVRKVQLYPLRAGSFSVDAMEVANKVEFSKSAVNKQTEQEISEGVYADTDFSSRANTEVYENSMSTEPVAITVKPLPAQNQPETFMGGTGHFSIKSTVEKKKLDRNEEGSLVVTIKGEGNFTQLSAPTIQWPAGIEGFEPSTKDSLDFTKEPMSGTRTFQFRFVSSKSGSYVIPAIHFSYFDPDSNSYKTVSTHDTSIVISTEEKQVGHLNEQPGKAKDGAVRWPYTVAGVVLLLTVAFYLYSTRRKKKSNLPATAPRETSVDEFLAPAYSALSLTDQRFYSSLRSCIWDYFSRRTQLSGSQLSKLQLTEVMKEKKIDPSIQVEVLALLEVCETGMFTDAVGHADKRNMLIRTKTVLRQLDAVGKA